MSRKYNAEAILDKQFKIDFNGYNAQEVDMFLDEVIKDYQAFEKELIELKDLLNKYEDTLSQQKRLIQELQSTNRVEKELKPQPTYLDLVKRISRLEEEVFNK